MNRKIIFIIISVVIVIAVVAEALVFWSDKKTPDVTDLLKINTTLQMNEMQKKQYEEIVMRLKKDSNDYYLRFALARLKQDLLDFAGAIELYERLGKEKPNDLLIWNNLAGIYYNQGKYEKAEELHLKILTISPKWYNSYEELGSIYQFHLKDKRPGFEKILLKGIEEYPEMKLALMAKLAVYYDEMMQNYPKAIEYYEKLVKTKYNIEVIAPRLKELKKIKIK
ncbi:tetratricopeptide repeat protein [Candidatus Falkowbacteria bacterium]|nr:tetratricopeptide repeat protein [Candidatus Falkowbacteria bacterium]